jgi:hypothetical protein
MSNTLSCPLPNTVNPLSTAGFKLSIAKLPDVSFFSQRVSIPEISTSSPLQGTKLSDIYLPGDKLEFSPLVVDFIVDENMSNYKSMYKWLVGLTKPESDSQFIQFLEEQTNSQNELTKQYSDGFVSILNNTFTQIATVNFIDLTPIALSAITFETTQSDVNYLVASATFNYTYYTIN